MGQVHDAGKVKPICAVTYGQSVSLEKALSELETILCSVEFRSRAFDFSFTEYYLTEMGRDLKKVFVSFTGLILPERLPDLKRQTNEIEAVWSAGGKRLVNLDPGYITTAKLVLASTKDFAHRLFLADGIYGDVQLQYRHGRFRTQPWTFPDYQTDLALDFFEEVRKGTYQELKKHG